jgi:hypothetical protein
MKRDKQPNKIVILSEIHFFQTLLDQRIFCCLDDGNSVNIVVPPEKSRNWWTYSLIDENYVVNF